jgi:hypothetical protein
MAQEQSAPRGAVVPSITMDTYRRILDLIFAPDQSAKGRIIFSLTLRTTPAFRPESQVRMYLFRDRSAKTEFVVAEKNVYYSSNQLLLSTGEGGADVLAKKTAVKRYTLSFTPTRILEWRRSLFRALDPTLQSLDAELTEQYDRRPVTLLLDGDTHDVWYTQGSAEIHIRIPEAATRSAFDKWAEAVQGAVSKMAQDSISVSDSIK